jgi:hypothetical protein
VFRKYGKYVLTRHALQQRREERKGKGDEKMEWPLFWKLFMLETSPKRT